MADKQPTEATKQVAENLYAGKFSTADELAQAYEEMAKKFGDSRNEVGQLREQAAKAAQYEQLATQYYQQANQAVPYQNWFVQNKDKILSMLQQDQTQRNTQNANMDASMPFTAEEYERIKQRIQQDVLAPYDQVLTQRAAEIQQAVLNQVQQNLQRQTKFMYDNFSRAFPEDQKKKLDEFIEWQTKYADPSSADPAKLADEALQMKYNNLNLESKLKDQETEMEKMRQQLAPQPLNGHPSSLFGESRPEVDGAADKDLATRQRILQEVQENSGDAYHEVFGGR